MADEEDRKRSDTNVTVPPPPGFRVPRAVFVFGSYVTDGVLRRNAKVRVIRSVSSLKGRPARNDSGAWRAPGWWAVR